MLNKLEKGSLVQISSGVRLFFIGYKFEIIKNKKHLCYLLSHNPNDDKEKCYVFYEDTYGLKLIKEPVYCLYDDMLCIACGYCCED